MKDNWIGIVILTKDGKYVVARATITDEKVDKLSDCAIKTSDIDGVKSDLKYPFVLLSDIEKLRKKLIEDLKEYLRDELADCETYIHAIQFDEWFKEYIEATIDKRFGVK